MKSLAFMMFVSFCERSHRCLVSRRNSTLWSFAIGKGSPREISEKPVA